MKKLFKERPKLAKILITVIVVIIVSIFFANGANSYYYDTVYGEEVATGNAFSNDFGTKKNLNEPTVIGCLFGEFTGNYMFMIKPMTSKIFLPTLGIFLGIGLVASLFIFANKEAKDARREGHEHGKKRVATEGDIKAYIEKFVDKVADYNLRFSERISLSLDNKKCNRNANVVVIGGSGTGKTFRYIKPNILQYNSSQIITDPSGELFANYSPWLNSKGNIVYCFNVKNMELSNNYNPLLNVYDENGELSPTKIDILVDLYMKNAKAGKEAGGGDPFWDKSEKAFLTAIIYHVLENDEICIEDKCFKTVLDLSQMASPDPNDPTAETELTKRINACAKRMKMRGKQPKAPMYYATFLTAGDKTASSIVVSTAVDLQIFATPAVDRLTRHNTRYPDMNINLDDLANTQSYLFLGIPNTNQAYNFLVAMIYSQLYERMYDIGDNMARRYTLTTSAKPTIGMAQFNPFYSREELDNFVRDVTPETVEDYIVPIPHAEDSVFYHLQYNGVCYKKSLNKQAIIDAVKNIPKLEVRHDVENALPVAVNFLLDEFKNIGEIPNFLTILATSRKYRIGSHVIIQAKSQLEVMYKDNEWMNVFGNCDTVLFLGVPDADTDSKKYIQEACSKTTIMQKSVSTSKTGTSISYTPTEVDTLALSDIDAINSGGRDDCIVIVRNTNPVIDHKIFPVTMERWKEAEGKAKDSEWAIEKFYTNKNKNILDMILV